MIENIANSETGLSVRTKLNTLIDHNYRNARVENLVNQPTWDETSGSGSVLDPDGTNNRYQVNTGATAGSEAIIRFGFRTGHVIGGDSRVTSFDKYWEAHIVISFQSKTTNGTTGFYIGKSFDAGAGDLSGKGFGFILKNEDLYVQAHNGTSLTEQDTGSNITDGNTHLIQLFFTPATSLEIWLDGSEIDEITSGLPSGTLGSSIRGFFEVANNADADSVYTWLHYCQLINEF